MRKLATALILALFAMAEAPEGYYRFPALHGDTLVFTAEGDLWKVGVEGGTAQRLTSHLEQETHATISPDGTTIAFVGRYEGPPEVYTLPLTGGLPQRHTWHGQVSWVVGWTPEGRILYSTRKYSTLPNNQLVSLDPANNEYRVIPLAQADQGVYDPQGKTLFFTRLPFQGSHAKRYKGGTVQNLWKFASEGQEAVPLTAGYAGTSKEAMWWRSRVYLLTDRDGTMNIWSMDENGRDLRQHTRHEGWDAKSPSMDDGRIAYQLGADIHLLDVRNNRDQGIPIHLASDLDQLRQRWVDEPMNYISDAHVSPKGDRVVLTARGELFVVPLKKGRFVEVTRRQDVRYRDGRFLPDGKSLVALSDETGEVEIWKLDAYGLPETEQLTTDGNVLRDEAIPSPDGKWIAHQDNNMQLWLLNTETKENTRIAETISGPFASFEDVRWSPDSRWLSFSEPADNSFQQIFVYRVDTNQKTALTTDRFNSRGAAWSRDGKWIYLLSDRNLRSVVGSPWGARQPEPYFDKSYKLYQIALKKDLRSPFLPDDEVYAEQRQKEEEEKKKKEEEEKQEEGKMQEADKDEKKPPEVEIELDGIAARLDEIPVEAGNYRNLAAGEKYLYWISAERGEKPALMRLEIKNEGDNPEKLAEDVRDFDLTPDGKKLMIRKPKEILIIDADKKPPTEAKALAKVKVDLSGWAFELDPREELRQMFAEAWRLHRDHFYDPSMHGVDWPSMREKYQPLLARVTDRQELSDLIAQMISELSAMHTFVGGGDNRKGQDQIGPASLGARLVRDPSAGGYRVDHIYEVDPDFPEKRVPLARPEVNVAEGEVILQVNGIDTLSAPDIGALLRNKANQQVRLRVRNAAGEERDVIVKPITESEERDRRYEDWEYSRRLLVDELGGEDIGYVHLRAMSSRDISQWARMFYPVFDRKGLIVDVRHNGGGNIDSWILGKLMRKAWFYWKGRVGRPMWNMQYAFRGHVVVLCNERTASDGEAFAEGFRRLGLGKLIGTRTWGGEVWLSGGDFQLVDRGVATNGQFGVYGPERQWLIEGHGVDPDIVVDNLPHATFNGEDAQLKAAVEHLRRLIAEQPVDVPPPPPYPDKSFGNGTQ